MSAMSQLATSTTWFWCSGKLTCVRFVQVFSWVCGEQHFSILLQQVDELMAQEAAPQAQLAAEQKANCEATKVS